MRIVSGVCRSVGISEVLCPVGKPLIPYLRGYSVVVLLFGTCPKQIGGTSRRAGVTRAWSDTPAGW
ncbi:MAG: hypothetical protein JNL03_03020 [Prolixibacteraceae bacterium]|nr:hypothetical protein [Prolixibacteraceae bacterium]